MVSFHSSKIADKIKDFQELVSEHHSHLDAFNEDLANLEGIFRSSGLGTFSAAVEPPSANITWCADTKRIIFWTESDGMSGYPLDSRPLIEMPASVRSTAKENNWLSLLLDQAFVEMQ